MKIDKNFKPELVVSTEETRFVLTESYLSGDKLVATNGRAMVVLPVERDDKDTDGYIPSAALKTARKLDKLADKASLVANTQLTCSDGSTILRKDLGNYPNWKQVLPPEDREISFSVALDADLLLRIASAIGATRCKNTDPKEQKIVTLVFKSNLDPIIVKPQTGSGAFGVLMPCRLQ